ncbi:MAG: hypothetical protein L0196_10750 [candidate division Zixibacteria bacterium]|nr:hypothetical protein [candidate division Zixibacteria bacterium]
MKSLVLAGRFLMLNLPLSCAASASKPAVHVPRGAPVVIDGRMEENEWDGSALHRLPDGTVVRLRHDHGHLFVGITTPRPGFASVCVAQRDSVRVFHASAALGSVNYARRAREWVTSDTQFVYGMRNTELNDQARAERSEYLSRHGWVASTFRMGGGLVQELQFSLTRIPGMTGLALAFFVPEGDTGAVVTWPAALPPDDGCCDNRLVRGYVPPHLRFDPSKWAVLALDP